MAKDTLSRAEARRTALAAQGFGRTRPNGEAGAAGAAGWRRIKGSIARMGLLQVDSISVLVRSHYLPVFSRLGAYDRDALDARAFQPRRRELFEYWGHECSLLPLDLQPLLRWRMARAERLDGVWGRVEALVRDRPDYVDTVLAQVRERGPQSARDFQSSGRRGGMWDWNDGKTALEYLFWSGRVSAAARRGFERIYDLSERVLPAEILARPTPPEAEAQRALVKLAARALGVATESDLRDYFRLSAADAKRAVAALVEAGELLPLGVEGWRQTAYLDPAAKTPRRVLGAALLTPFDPLIWERARTERLFDFRYRVEIYTPAGKRKHGYYVLPFLLDGRLVARVDLKSDRPAGALRVLASHLEAGADSAAVAAALAAELRRLATWLGLSNITVARKGELAVTLDRCFG